MDLVRLDFRKSKNSFKILNEFSNIDFFGL